jgi:hypothetical protein
LYPDGRLVVENEVGALPGSASVELAPNDNFSGGEGDFFPNLVMVVPTGLNNGRCDILGADVAFGKRLLQGDLTSERECIALE